MNDVLKTILTAGLHAASQVVPGGPLVADGIDALISKRTDAGIPETAEGLIQAIEAIKKTDVANEVQFEVGLEMVRQGYHQIKASLKQPHDGTPDPA